VFSTSKRRAAPRREWALGFGRQDTRRKRAQLDNDVACIDRGLTSTGSGWGSTEDTFARDGSRLTGDGLDERGRKFRLGFGAPALDRGGRF
jgi:hypothetical protein